MNWRGKITKIISLLFLALALFACDGDGCVEADEFDNEYVKVKANPESDGIFGSYDHNSGGQTANWHNTGLTTNGSGLALYVSGQWAPWYGSAIDDGVMKTLPRCNFCAKRSNVASENCLCYKNQIPTNEKGIDGVPVTGVNCSGNSTDQDDPAKCTCTTRNGLATDYGVFHFPLTFYKKDHSPKLPDEQGDVCKYDRGMGLYLGVFGRSGGETPLRIYHLFSETRICPITINSNGECIDKDGNDRAKYLFKTKNLRNFVKDDLAGNDGLDGNGNDDVYHQPNEYIKLIIHDRYYSDNSGGYKVTFLQGINRDGDTGLLEFLVDTIENAMLGTVDQNGVARPSVLEYMYKAIVQDTYFAATVQITLSLYVAFFGLASLIGLTEITTKELRKRILKIALIIFFINPNSWYFYNSIVVGFFKDSMDFLITMLTNMADSNIEETASIKIAQMSSYDAGSSASRFSYVDSMLKTLFAENVTKKIWGLFFSSIFGLIYIIIIYALIFFFLYVMLHSATVYVMNLMKLVFVLCLGPIFMVFTLFSQTADMFKNWLAFVAARSLEIIMLFLILYTFVMLIDKKFNDLLSYRTCYEHLSIGGLSLFDILVAQTSKGLVDWLHDLISIGGLIYMLQLVMGEMPKVAGALIAVNGASGGGSTEAGKGQLSGTAKFASSMMNAGYGLAKQGASAALTHGGGGAFRLARQMSRTSGLSGAFDAAADKIPFRGPRALLRDSVINKAISDGKKVAAAKGLKPGDEGYDATVRNHAMGHAKEGIRAWQHNNKNKAALYGMTQDNIDKRLDQKLVKEPLAKFLKQEAKKLKSLPPGEIPLGKDMEKMLKSRAREWADKGLTGGAKSLEPFLKDFKGLMKEQGKMSSSEAAQNYATSPELKQKFMMHLQERKAQEALKSEKAQQKGGLAKFGDNLSKNLKSVFRRDTQSLEENFIRKSNYQEGQKGTFLDYVGIDSAKGWNLKKRINFLDVGSKANQELIAEQTAKAARDFLVNGGTAREKEKIKDYYQAKTATLPDGFYKRRLLGTKKRLGKSQEKQLEADDKRAFYKETLGQKTFDDMKKKISTMTTEEMDEARKKAKNEFEEMRLRHNEEMKKLIGNPDLAKFNGGIENYRDGLINFEGNSLFEASKRLEAFGVGSNKPGTDEKDPKDAIKDLQNAMQPAIDKLSAAEAALQNNNLAAANASLADLKRESPLPQEFKLEFGASINDALGLQASQLTPQGGSVLLGGQELKAKDLDVAMIMSCEYAKSGSSYDLRVKKFEKAIKEQELSAASDADKPRISAEIAKLSDNIKDTEAKIDIIDKQLSNLKNPL